MSQGHDDGASPRIATACHKGRTPIPWRHHRECKQPWIAWICAAPLPFLGVALGIYLSVAAWNRSNAEDLARSPGEVVCGNPGIFFLFQGFVGGSVGGVVAGVAIANLVTRLVRGPAAKVTVEEISGGEDWPIGDPIVDASKHKELHAEIDLVERMVLQAENDGDEEVLRKLIKYKATLEREVGH